MDGSDNPMVGGLTRATPENQQERLDNRPESSEAIRQPSRYLRDEEMVHASRRRGGSPVTKRTGPSEIPCRVDNELPLERAISLANPANNGEALLAREGDPVGSRELSAL